MKGRFCFSETVNYFYIFINRQKICLFIAEYSVHRDCWLCVCGVDFVCLLLVLLICFVLLWGFFCLFFVWFFVFCLLVVWFAFVGGFWFFCLLVCCSFLGGCLLIVRS